MRNSITPLPGGRLRKEYRGTLAWKRETTLLRQMAGSGLCPELLDAPLRQAEMTECPGVPLGECVRAASRQEAREMMAALAAWTDAFEREYHRRTGQTAVLEDLSPGNFLWDATSRKITGLDFEFWHTGSPAENRGGLLCMAERLKAAEITGEELTEELYRQFRGGFDRAELEHQAARARQQTALRQRAMPLIRQTAG